MRVESARALKQELHEMIIGPQLLDDTSNRSIGLRSKRTVSTIARPSVALGITKTTNNDDGFQLAVRIQHSLLIRSGIIERIRERAQGEVDVRFVGPIRTQQASWYQQRCRPLCIGCSTGHYRVTAGTVGAFVRDQSTGTINVLSNNHVLADENRGAVGDDVLQPGSYDGGIDPNDSVSTLSRFIPIDFQQPNLVDCAIAELSPGIQYDPTTLTSVGRLGGLRTSPLAGNEDVVKIGRTTGITRGVVSAIELDDVTIDYDQGQAVFHSQIEFQGTPTVSFSEGGDSGSLILDEQGLAIALLFAGSATGGPGNLGFTYGNPLEEVLSQLRVDLLS